MSRRSAKRSARQATERPGLDHDVLISLLELDPDFAAMLRGEEPPGSAPVATIHQVEYEAVEQTFTIEHVDIVVAPAFGEPVAEPVQPEARVIDVTATVEQVRVGEAKAAKSASRSQRTRKPKAPKAPRSRAGRTRQRPSGSPVYEQLAAMQELENEAPAAEQVAAVYEFDDRAPASEQVAAIRQIDREAPPARRVAAVELAVREVPAAEQVAAISPSLERTLEKARAEIAERNLPIHIPAFGTMMAGIQQAGWSLPPVRRLQWDYMNFEMPPLSTVVLTPRQAKRQEWRTMLKYYRINPYKSHYRQDQKEARRMISQAKRAKLYLA